MHKMGRELRTTVIPMASFEGSTVESAAKELWKLAAEENSYFSERELEIDLPEMVRKQPYSMQLAHCPVSEWYSYLGQSSKSGYVMVGSKLVLAPVGKLEEKIPAPYRAGENIHLFFLSSWDMIKRIGREDDPADPFD